MSKNNSRYTVRRIAPILLFLKIAHISKQPQQVITSFLIIFSWVLGGPGPYKPSPYPIMTHS
jgi:hypothetical protein